MSIKRNTDRIIYGVVCVLVTWVVVGYLVMFICKLCGVE